MTKQEALDLLYEGDLYDAFGYVTADGYAALVKLEGVVLQERKTGKWVADGCRDICSECAASRENQLWDAYCGRCGAKMEVDG